MSGEGWRQVANVDTLCQGDGVNIGREREGVGKKG